MSKRRALSARFLGVSASLVYAYVERKQIPHDRIGRCIRFQIHVLEGWRRQFRIDLMEESMNKRGRLRNMSGALYKRENSAYWWVRYPNSKGGIEKESTGTADREENVIAAIAAYR